VRWPEKIQGAIGFFLNFWPPFLSREKVERKCGNKRKRMICKKVKELP
jgi:hypothetical protein